MKFRVGIGYDSHRFAKGRPLVLGGVKVPYEYGLLGHSDADVVLHAICDGILGALGKGDIGEHFPDTDPAYKDIDSTKLLERVYALAAKAKLAIGNVDVIVLAQEPNLKQFKKAMAARIADILKTDVTAVNIKATTNEGMGFIGRKEGIACYAAVALVG
jgi:2-C-methyl-D-erythritol 2,4-cyclodiphosphate synthase